MRTSYSSIDTYNQCPQKFKFQAIDKIRSPKSKEAIFGTLIHSTLKFMFHRDPLFPTLDEVVGHFRNNWPRREIFELEVKNDPLKYTWSEEEEKIYFEEGVRVLKKFYEKNAPWNFNIIDLESRFEIDLADEKTGEKHILAGIIDRIDKLPDETYEIIDYKTSKRMPSQGDLNKNLQLSLYSLALQKRWPHLNIDNIKLSLYFLKHGEKLTTKRNDEEILRTKNKLLETIREIQNKIKNGAEFEPMPSVLCNWCEYRPRCPAWKHLYKKQESVIDNQEEINKKIDEYFATQKMKKEQAIKLTELQKVIKEYMEKEGLTRVFGNEGSIAKKNIERYGYDFEKIKEVLAPLGKWEEILVADETKLKQIMKEFPEDIRAAIINYRSVVKSYTILSISSKKEIKKPEDKPQA